MVKAEWSLDGKAFTLPVDLSKATYSADGSKVEFDTTVSYDELGTHFPTVRIFSERNGDVNASFTSISNLDKVRIVVQ